MGDRLLGTEVGDKSSKLDQPSLGQEEISEELVKIQSPKSLLEIRKRKPSNAGGVSQICLKIADAPTSSKSTLATHLPFQLFFGWLSHLFAR
ncbi:hypothetical protein [Gemmata obscuriglobus]|uniref:hypothetical protein n=1 Tax=Gemmata obscuriglobus TaxID=114 RepID=UPI0011CEBD8E|nr:hypothetical protein [Gemmata obscuriglobus]